MSESESKPKPSIFFTDTFRFLIAPIVAPSIIVVAGIVGTNWRASELTRQALASQNELTSQRFEFLQEDIAAIQTDINELKVKVDFGTSDRYRRSEHESYAADMRERLNALETRLRAVENAVSRTSGD